MGQIYVFVLKLLIVTVQPGDNTNLPRRDPYDVSEMKGYWYSQVLLGKRVALQYESMEGSLEESVFLQLNPNIWQLQYQSTVGFSVVEKII